MRITEKGQVTIPKPIRERLRIGPGSEVNFLEREDGSIELIKGAGEGARGDALLRDLDEWFREVEGTGDSGLTAAEIMEMTRGRGERDPR